MKKIYSLILFFVLCFPFYVQCETENISKDTEEAKIVETEPEKSQEPNLSKNELVKHYLQAQEGIIPLIKFKDVDIRIVLDAISQKATKDGKKINILVSPGVKGLISINLENVDWLRALEAIVRTYNYDYEFIGDNIILVATLEEFAEKRKKEVDVKVLEPLEIVEYKLKFLDAYEVAALLAPQLTPRGRIAILPITVQKGWKPLDVGAIGAPERLVEAEKITTTAITAETKEVGGVSRKSDTLVITDTKSNLIEIKKIIEKIDVMPKQVLIETKIVEVNKDRLKDIGFDYGTGSRGVTDKPSILKLDKKSKRGMGGSILGDVAPSVFGPKAGDITSVIPYSMGLELIFRKFTGAEFEAILHALEENVYINVLSAPRITALDGQEAYIMVGERRPIIKSEIQSSETSVGISKRMDYYQPIGIRLSVLPKICSDDSINMLIYPSITSSSQNVPATSQIGSVTTTDYYPILLVRETQTQILMKSGETIAMGGLLKDVKAESIFKIPLLGDIPIIGRLFQRKTVDTEKVELIIFITAHIIDPMQSASLELNATPAISKSKR